MHSIGGLLLNELYCYLLKNKSFVLRIDAESMDAIEKWAADEFRSTNGLILCILYQNLKKNTKTPKPKKSKTSSEEQ